MFKRWLYMAHDTPSIICHREVSMSIALGALPRPTSAAPGVSAPPFWERIATRLCLGYAAVIALMLVVLAVTLLQLAQVRQATEDILGVQAERVALAREWRQNIAVNAARTLAIGLSQDESLGRLLGPDMAATTQRTGEIQQRMVALLTTEAGKAGMQRMAALRERYLASRADLFKARGDNAALAAATEQFRKAIQDYAGEADQMVVAMLKHNAAAGSAVYLALRRTQAVFIALLLLAVGLAVWQALSQARKLVGPLSAARDAATCIAGGDLSYPLRVSGKGEVAELMQALQTMAQSLRGLVVQVREGGQSIVIAGDQVAVGNADLSRRTEVTASDLQVTASSMSEMAGTLRQTADVAVQANQLVNAASEVAQRGGSVVAEVVSTMDQINHSSQKIADIIGVIDGIAFQTNILALNAAVEAARAGEQGRGFAVVAGEVRTLAQRSAEAAREIKTLIGTSVERTEAGARLVGQAGQTMAEVVASVARVSGLIAEISAAASEQRDGIEQINAAVSRLDAATQQNASLVEQSSAAADSLQQQARRLNDAVGAYKV
jgi:methyl-accepting chemotaxis protein